MEANDKSAKAPSYKEACTQLGVDALNAVIPGSGRIRNGQMLDQTIMKPWQVITVVVMDRLPPYMVFDFGLDQLSRV